MRLAVLVHCRAKASAVLLMFGASHPIRSLPEGSVLVRIDSMNVSMKTMKARTRNRMATSLRRTFCLAAPEAPVEGATLALGSIDLF